jgi:polyphosphate kinase 2
MKKKEKRAKQAGKSRAADIYDRYGKKAVRAELDRVLRGKPRKHGQLTNLKRKDFEREMDKLQVELVKLQETIKKKGLRVAVIFEGRDTAGKGGAIKWITANLSPRVARITALGVPSDREKTQWYFQRYAAHLPAAGEMVLFDRSWYNRAGVEHVMGFCTDDEYEEFLRACPDFERMLIRSGIILIKYWFVVSAQEQEKRFQARTKDPTRRWKLSPMDLETRKRWTEYSQAYVDLFAATHTKDSPWHLVDGEVKRRARLNCISHLLSMIEYDKHEPKRIKLGKRPSPRKLRIPKISEIPIVIPERY